MKKVSTAAAKATKNLSQLKLTIGLDLGDRSSWYCLLDEVGEVLLERKVSTSKSDGGGVRRDAAQPDRSGNRNAFSVGEPDPSFRFLGHLLTRGWLNLIAGYREHPHSRHKTFHHKLIVCAITYTQRAARDNHHLCARLPRGA